MGALLKLIICFYILSLIFSMFCALIRFFVDVAKWHDKENKVRIISSKESEVLINGRKYNDNTGNRGTGDNDDNNDNTGEFGRGEPLKF